jgi:hypothetical protein
MQLLQELIFLPVYQKTFGKLPQFHRLRPHKEFDLNKAQEFRF